MQPCPSAKLVARSVTVVSMLALSCCAPEAPEDGEPKNTLDAASDARDGASGSPSGMDGSTWSGADSGTRVEDGSVLLDAGRSDAATPTRDAGASVVADAATSDGGSMTGAADAGGASCPRPNALFCEDFEGLTLGAAQATARWQPAQRTATLTIDEARAQGRRALHIAAQGNGYGYLALRDFAPPGNSFFGRMRVFVDALPTAPNYAHYTLVEAAGTPSGMIRPIGGQFVQGMGNLLGPGSDGGPTGDWTNWKPSAPLATGRWVCLEWELAAADNTIRVWVDGEAKPDLTVSTKRHGGTQVDFVFPTFQRLWFGWWLYQSGSTPDRFDVWLDDLAVASTRVGCM